MARLAPLAALRKAILAADWAGVREVYAALTGESLKEPKAGPAGKAPPSKKPAARKPATKKPAKPAPPPPEHAEAAEEAEAAGGLLLVKPRPVEGADPDRRYARAAPGPVPFVNTWVPPKASARELEIDRKLLAGVEPSERDRPPADDRRVKVECDGCGARFECPAWEANRTADDKERMLNKCPRCLGR